MNLRRRKIPAYAQTAFSNPCANGLPSALKILANDLGEIKMSKFSLDKNQIRVEDVRKMKTKACQCIWGIALAILFIAANYAAAFYDPHIGRWINRDPIGEDGGKNIYAFVDNDSISFYDDVGIQKAASQQSKLILIAIPFGVTRKGYCGDVALQIWWTLLNAVQNTQGGHVVQEITITWKITDCKTNPINPIKSLDPKWKNPGSVHYWEAWPVAKYASFTNPKDDNFGWIDEGDGTKGTVSWKATASFYQGLKTLPIDMIPGNKNTLAGGFPSTTINPNFSNGTDPVPHEMEIEWNCCCANGQPTRRLTEVKKQIPSLSK